MLQDYINMSKIYYFLPFLSFTYNPNINSILKLNKILGNRELDYIALSKQYSGAREITWR